MTAILLPRPAGEDGDAPLLESLGYEVVRDPYVEARDLVGSETDATRTRLLGALADPSAIFIATSPRAVASLLRGARPSVVGSLVVAVGATTAAACAAAGFTDVRRSPAGSSNTDLLDLLRTMSPATAVVPRSSAAPSDLVDAIAGLGWKVVTGVLYEVRAVTAAPASAARLAAGGFDVVVVRSGSAARALARFVQPWPATTAVVAAGEPTASVLRAVGIPVAAVAACPDAEAVVDAVVAVVGS